MGLHYDNPSYVVIAIGTSVFLGIALIFTVINIVTHVQGNYSYNRKRPLVMIFIIVAASIIILKLSLWLYPYSDIIDVFVQICLSVGVFFMYQYMKETLMFYSGKYIKKNPDSLKNVIKDDKICDYMQPSKYPMSKVGLFPRAILTDHYSAYGFMLEGHVDSCCGKGKKRNFSFKEAIKVQNFRTSMMTIYFLTVPIAQGIGMYLMQIDETNITKILSLVCNNYVLIMTVWTVIYLQSFAQNFSQILPFEKFKTQLMSILLMQGLFNIGGGVLRQTGIKIDTYDAHESCQLLFICIYSFILCLFTLGHFLFINASVISSTSNDKNKTLKISKK